MQTLPSVKLATRLSVASNLSRMTPTFTIPATNGYATGDPHQWARFPRGVFDLPFLARSWSQQEAGAKESRCKPRNVAPRSRTVLPPRAVFFQAEWCAKKDPPMPYRPREEPKNTPFPDARPKTKEISCHRQRVTQQ